MSSPCRHPPCPLMRYYKHNKLRIPNTCAILFVRIKLSLYILICFDTSQSHALLSMTVAGVNTVYSNLYNPEYFVRRGRGINFEKIISAEGCFLSVQVWQWPPLFPVFRPGITAYTVTVRDFQCGIPTTQGTQTPTKKCVVTQGRWPHPGSPLLVCLFVCLFVCLLLSNQKFLLRLPSWTRSKNPGSISIRAA